MATTTHYIYSHYVPEEQEEVSPAEADEKDPWLTESTFGVNRRLANPPRFVSATVRYDQLADDLVNSSTVNSLSNTDGDDFALSAQNLSGWYRSLVGREEKKPVLHSEQQKLITVPAPGVFSTVVKVDKNNWFIAKALASENISRSTSPHPPAPTLADILAREPPPDSHQERVVPPVFLTIGPTNKGFEMLQKSGWQEGEALGRTAARRGGIGFRIEINEQQSDEAASLTQSDAVKQTREVLIDCGEDVQEVRHVDVIDLTSGVDSLDDDVEEALDELLTDTRITQEGPANDVSLSEALLDHNPKALLTPLPTILKSDRLGIGLKAKRAGPYGESVKRVTHSQVAMTAHAKRAEEMRNLKVKVGRGRRGFERMQKKESQDRQALFAYLNA